MALANETREALAARYNELTGKNIKPASYTKAVLIQKIEDAENFLSQATGTAPEEDDEPVSTVTCPMCGHEDLDENFKALGEEEPLSACVTCPECDKSFNVYSGAEVPTPKAKGKRRVLNPQATINRKTEHLLKETGANMFFDREERLWTITHDEFDDSIYLTSKELSTLSKEALVELVNNQPRRS